MAEKADRVEIEHTYTVDQFTVFFYGDRVFIGRQDYPIGQCCVDILNLDASVFDEINRRVSAFVPAARALLAEKTDSAAALAQERLNAVWEVIFALPVYRDLKMDEPCNYHTFQRLIAGAGSVFSGLRKISRDADGTDLLCRTASWPSATDCHHDREMP